MRTYSKETQLWESGIRMFVASPPPRLLSNHQRPKYDVRSSNLMYSTAQAPTQHRHNAAPINFGPGPGYSSYYIGQVQTNSTTTHFNEKKFTVYISCLFLNTKACIILHTFEENLVLIFKLLYMKWFQSETRSLNRNRNTSFAFLCTIGTYIFIYILYRKGQMQKCIQLCIYVEEQLRLRGYLVP